jgi:hypothetical protein
MPPTGCNAMKQCNVSSFEVQGRVTVVLLGSSDGRTVVALMCRLRIAQDTVDGSVGVLTY